MQLVLGQYNLICTEECKASYVGGQKAVDTSVTLTLMCTKI